MNVAIGVIQTKTGQRYLPFRNIYKIQIKFEICFKVNEMNIKIKIKIQVKVMTQNYHLIHNASSSNISESH